MAGWNRPGEAPKKAAKKPSPVRGVVAGALVVALAAGAYFAFFAGTGEKPQKAVKEKSPSAIREVTTAPAPNAKAVEPVAKGEKTLVAKPKVGKDGRPVFDKPDDQLTPEERALKTAWERFDKRRPVLSEPTDQLLNMAVSTDPEDRMAPMPVVGNVDAAFRKSLEKPIEILESDSDEIRAIKERVIEARESMKALLAEGRSVESVLAQVNQEHNEGVDIFNSARDELMEIVERGDVEGAKKYRDKVNEVFKTMGIKALALPDEERLSRIRAMRERMAAKKQASE